MGHQATSAFWRAYLMLPGEIRDRADKQFSLLKANPRHASLHFKKVGERLGQEIWSVRINLYFRALALRNPEGYLWFWIGNHSTYDLLVG